MIPSTGRWRRGYEQVLAGQLDSGLPPAGTATRRWLDRQVRAMRGGRLDPPRRALLAELGVHDQTLTGTEETFLAELDWWIREHGHARVPQAATSRGVAGGPYWLGKRVAETRTAHRRGALSRPLARELNRRPGWSWHAAQADRAERWAARCAELERHVAAEGSLVGVSPPLYSWLRRQRAQRDTLSADRAARLERIPGALVASTSHVPAFLQAARQWLAAAPDRDMSHLRYTDTVTVDGQTVPLGRRASYYRRRYHQLEGTHQLPATQIRQIESLPGWSWAPRTGSRAGGRHTLDTAR